MKITFVYPDLNTAYPKWSGYFYQGIASIAAVLKKAHHTVFLIHITDPNYSKEKFISAVRSKDPDLIAFSMTTLAFQFVKKLIQWLNDERIKAKIICGGVHPTISPEETIGHPGIDMICRGEGEKALARLCECLEKDKDVRNILNIWVKDNEKIYRNPLGPLNNLDALPFADRTIFDYKNLVLERDGKGLFMASRGCPYRCSYCVNHTLHELYNSKSVRFRSVDNVILEIKEAIYKYPFIKRIVFDDDILFLNKKWASEFTLKYPQEIGVPFMCNMRPNLVDEDLVRLMKKAGCDKVNFGLESGNDFIRNKILNRNLTRTQLMNAFHLCKKEGIQVRTFNMMGFPYETAYNVLETIKLNAEGGVDEVGQASIFYPFPHTKLYDLCRDKGFLKKHNRPEGAIYDYFSESVMSLDTISKKQIIALHRNFNAMVKIYKAVFQLNNGLRRFFESIFDRIFSSTYFPIGAAVIIHPVRKILRVAKRCRTIYKSHIIQ